MKQKINDAGNFLLKAASKKILFLRISILIVLIFSGLITYTNVKDKKIASKCEDCTPYKSEITRVNDQNRQLLGALIHVQELTNSSQITSLTGSQGRIILANFNYIDTTPKQREINRYIDSIKLKWKQDSIKKSKSIIQLYNNTAIINIKTKIFNHGKSTSF